MGFGMVDIKCAFCGSEDFVCYSKSGNPVEAHKVRAKAYWAVIEQQAAEAAAKVFE